MNQYVINETTLQDIADAIKSKTGITDSIATLEFAPIIRSLDLSTLEYMAIIDITDGKYLDYTDYEINAVDEFIKFYGGENNG